VLPRGRDHDPIAEGVATGVASRWLLGGREFKLQTGGEHVVASEGPGAGANDRVGDWKTGIRLGR
jgi:hypothetical protein